MLTLLCCHQSHRFVSLAASEHLHPPSTHNSGVPSESLASSPVHTAVEWSDCERLALPLLIGQGQPWDEPRDTSLIYYTHASPGHQREGTSSTPSTTSAASLSLSLLFFCLCTHSLTHMHNQRRAHTHCTLLGCSVRCYSSVFGTWISCCSLVLFPSFLLLSTSSTPGPKITHFTSHWNIQHYNQQISFNSVCEQGSVGIVPPDELLMLSVLSYNILQFPRCDLYRFQTLSQGKNILFCVLV